MASRYKSLLLAAAVLCAAAAQQVAKPQYRVVQEKASTVVSIFAGQKPTGGYSIVVTGVERQSGTCTVRYRVEAPDPDAIVPQVLTYPEVTRRLSPPCQDVRVDPPLPRSSTK